jgi:patatin-like phospholipase/acyl hydrolase
MATLFDLIAGTSTGGILTAALVTPKEEGSSEPAYYSDTVISLYKEYGPDIFRDR